MSDRGDDWPLVARFWAEFDGAPGEEKSAVLRAWCERHPGRALAFREQVLAELQLREVTLQMAPPAPGAPTRLGDFRVVRKIGEGGMGAVYEAIQEPFGRQVALKTRKGAGTPEDLRRFLREGQVLSDLHHTHILPVYAAGRCGDTDYFAMQFVDGASLREILDHVAGLPPGGRAPSLRRLAAEKRGWARRPPATPPRCHGTAYVREAAEVAAEVAEAVAHAHEKNVLHRDLKPSNVMIDARGHVWLIDFSLAGFAPTPAPDPEATTSREELTRGDFLGTLAFAAPEQLRGEPDARTDVWGLGVILYALLTLRRPYEGESLPATRAQREAELQAPLEISRAAGVPRDLHAICRKCLEKEPGRRYQTARAVADDLRRFLRGEATEARPRGAAERAWRLAKQKSTAFVVGTCALALAASYTVAALLQAHPTNRGDVERFAERVDQDRLLMENIVRTMAGEVEGQAGPSIHALAGVSPEELKKRTHPKQRDLTRLLDKWQAEYNRLFNKREDLGPKLLLNLFVLDRERAVLLADTEAKTKSVGARFVNRNYHAEIEPRAAAFHDDPTRERPVYSSYVYESYQDERYKFSIITPLRYEGAFVGYLVATVPIGWRLGLLDMKNAPKGAKVLSRRDWSHQPPPPSSEWENYRYGVVLSALYEGGRQDLELEPVHDARQERTLDRFHGDRKVRGASDVWPTEGRFAHYARVGDSHFVAVVEQSYLEAVGWPPVVCAALVGGGLLLLSAGRWARPARTRN